MKNESVTSKNDNERQHASVCRNSKVCILFAFHPFKAVKESVFFCALPEDLAE